MSIKEELRMKEQEIEDLEESLGGADGSNNVTYVHGKHHGSLIDRLSNAKSSQDAQTI